MRDRAGQALQRQLQQVLQPQQVRFCKSIHFFSLLFHHHIICCREKKCDSVVDTINEQTCTSATQRKCSTVRHPVCHVMKVGALITRVH